MSIAGNWRMAEVGLDASQRTLLPAEASAVCCERLDAEGFIAYFTLRLDAYVADAHAAADMPAYDNFLLEHAVAAIDPGQQVRFVFRRHGAGIGLTQVTFDVHGQAIDTDSTAAESSAQAVVRCPEQTLGR